MVLYLLDAWFAEHPENVAGIHCKAGKGRTGLMIAVYLVHCGEVPTAIEALKKFAVERTNNAKGVTIPSQIRYCHYYHQAKMKGLLAEELSLPCPAYQITHIRLVTVPSFNVGGGCEAYFQVKKMWTVRNTEGALTTREESVFDYKEKVKSLVKSPADAEYVDFDCTPFNLIVRGDVKLIFNDVDAFHSSQKMCHVWFNTAFIENNFLCFHKIAIDKACKDKKEKYFKKEFAIEVFMHQVELS
jgi:phosphatidylinositol-3,4,5-trisphosphate 3-phosphatase/dual-specificity protein phosphatase PTEN